MIYLELEWPIKLTVLINYSHMLQIPCIIVKNFVCVYCEMIQ